MHNRQPADLKFFGDCVNAHAINLVELPQSRLIEGDLHRTAWPTLAANLDSESHETTGDGASPEPDTRCNLVEAQPLDHIEMPECVVVGLSRLHGTSP